MIDNSSKIKRLGIIVNNYGKQYDGIGAYSEAISRHFSENIEKHIYTGYCVEDDSVVSKLTNLGMTKATYRAIKELKGLDTILFEYPFVEWNPVIVPMYYYLSRQIKKNNKKLVLSLHEYSRVNRLRKAVIRLLLKKANLVLVSSNDMKNDISQYASNISIRNVPTNIVGSIEKKDIEKSKNNFVYFGLINKAKAFDEMIEAWDEFNSEEKYKLSILTGTKLDWDDSKHKNVEYHYRADNDEVFRIMSESMFNVVPVKPEVDMKNATFKTGCIAGCIAIGKFCREYDSFKFCNGVKKYDKESFLSAFEEAIKNGDLLPELSKSAIEFGRQYTPESVACEIEKVLF